MMQGVFRSTSSYCPPLEYVRYEEKVFGAGTCEYHDMFGTYPEGMTCEHKDGSFNKDFGIHDQYAIIDVKHWLGY